MMFLFNWKEAHEAYWYHNFVKMEFHMPWHYDLIVHSSGVALWYGNLAKTDWQTMSIRYRAEVPSPESR